MPSAAVSCNDGHSAVKAALRDPACDVTFSLEEECKVLVKS
jgi:hypothetical protein